MLVKKMMNGDVLNPKFKASTPTAIFRNGLSQEANSIFVHLLGGVLCSLGFDPQKIWDCIRILLADVRTYV